MKIFIKYLLPLLLIVGMVGCSKEFPNPNAATKDEVLKSPDGLMGMAAGLRTSWSVGGTSPMYSIAVCNGLTTRELFVLNTGNAELAGLEAGRGSLNNLNSSITNLWTGCNAIKTNAQLIIDNANKIGDAGTKAGVLAYGYLFKALALGTMAQYWEQVTSEVITPGQFLEGRKTQFVGREAALDEAISLLKQAETTLLANNVSPSFISKVGPEIELVSSIQALLARYLLIRGQYTDAFTAAGKAESPSRISFIRFDMVNQNPLFRSGFVNNNTIGGLANFGLTGELRPDSLDGRIPFYLGGTTLSKVTGFFKGDLDAIPFYIPSEMILIKAEALARQDNVNGAITELNRVLTKTADPLGLVAKLPAYSGPETREAVLLEIYKQRCIELYLSGQKLEDSRRFGRPGPLSPNFERTRNFYPYPAAERDNNSNTPADPEV